MLQIDNISDSNTYSLVLGTECDPFSVYTTLSYCCGKPSAREKVKLLSSTFTSLRSGKAISSLPKTFREAVQVNVRPGIRYLWIDSLFILQDSADDWKVEALTMREVYRNSYLTMSAVSRADDDSGLLFRRDVAPLAPAVVRLKLQESQSPRTYHNPSKQTSSWEQLWLQDGVTTQRGWYVQERFLSPRTIHFGKRLVFWECRKQNASELNHNTVYLDASVYNNETLVYMDDNSDVKLSK